MTDTLYFKLKGEGIETLFGANYYIIGYNTKGLSLPAPNFDYHKNNFLGFCEKFAIIPNAKTFVRWLIEQDEQFFVPEIKDLTLEWSL